jgi:DTW domain-containing protein
MSGRLAEHRCPRCEIRKPLCFCEFIPRLSLQTRVVFLMHTGERVLTTNTARLAAKALPNSEIRIRGRKDERLSLADLEQDGRHALLLYPSSHAAELNADFVAGLAGPVTLIVPDGSWAQMRRFVRRDAALAGFRHVKLPPGPASTYRLRVQPDAQSLCTLEAVARAIGILESTPAQQQLEALLRTMVERTLWSRGAISGDQCEQAIPPAARIS